MRPPELLPTVSKLFDCPLRAQPSAPPPAAALGPALRSDAPCCGPRLRRAAYAWALPGRRWAPSGGRSPPSAPAQRPGLKIVRSRSGLCRGFPPPAPAAPPPPAAAGSAWAAPPLSARRAAARFPVGGRRSRPKAAALPAGVARPSPPGGLRWLRAAAALRPCLSPPALLGGSSCPAAGLGSPPGASLQGGSARLRRSPAPPPPSRPPLPGAALRAAGFALAALGPRRRGRAGGRCGGRLFSARALPGGGLRGSAARGHRAPRWACRLAATM